VERMIPAWGLYRLFMALEQKKAFGELTLKYPDGMVRFSLKRGCATNCATDIDGLSFAEFLVQSGMVPDRAAAARYRSVEQLIVSHIVRAEDSRRFINAYVRNVVDILLPAPVLSWTLASSVPTETASSEEAVDMCAELFTVVQRHPDLRTMRSIVARLGARPTITDCVHPGCLIHAKAHFKGVPLVVELVNGRCPPITPSLLADETNLRILFAFSVAGGLVSGVDGTAPLTGRSGTPTGGVPNGFDFDEFRAPGHSPAEPPKVEPQKPDPAVTQAAPDQTATGGSPGESSSESGDDMSLDLAVDPRRSWRGSNSRRDDYLVMDENGSIQGNTAAAKDVKSGRPAETLVDPELEKAIKAELTRAARLNHYEMLEIAPDARVSAVRMAVLRNRRRYSPSRYEGGVSAESLKGLESLIDRINKVGDILSDLNLRVAYNRSQGISTPGLEAQLAAIFEARGFWRQGMQLLEQRNANDALEMFERAENCDSEEPDYFCAQGNALLAMAPADDTYETIESLLDVAMSFDQDLVGAHMLYAEYMVRKNDFEAAQVHIRKVLALDPESREARAFRVKTKVSLAGGQVNFKKKQDSILQRALKLIKR